MKILISGALGFMGREVAVQAKAQGHEIACGVDIVPGTAEFPLLQTFEGCPAADVIIDFSTWKPGADLLTFAVQRRIPAVIAATGLSEEQLAAIDKAAKVIPVFRSGNMSLGIALMRALAKKAAAVLGETFDIEIVETHHNRKADAPSGTALMLLDAVKAGCESEREAAFGRHGRDCKRRKQEIGVHALRGGTVTGEHEVCFFGAAERMKITHTAESRSVFAAGALKAAEFLMNAAPGLYSMDDVVGNI